MRKIVLPMLCAGIAVLSAPAPVSGQTDGARQARIIELDFDPRDFSVPAGTTVTWTNTDQRPHTVTDRGGTFDTGPVAPGATASVTFSTPGRFSYFCRINPGRMNGTVDVQAGAEPVKTVRVQATDQARTGETALRFDPAELTVQTGTAVVFANVGGKPHTMTADEGSFDTGVVTPGPEGGKFAGTNATFVVTKPGTIPFHCEVHPAAMKGVLTVTGEEVSDAPAAASGAARSATIEMKDFAFENAEVSVAPSGEVTWRNAGDAPHSATFDDVDLDTDVVQPGSEAQLQAPAEPGNYSYRCKVHPARMRGVLVVLGQNIEDPTESAQAAPAAAGSAGPPGGIPPLALATGVIGAFLGGMGVASFMRKRPPAPAASGPAEPPPTRAGPTANL